MANYKRISEIAALVEVTDTTNILVEENGVFKKISSSEFDKGMPVIILKNENYDNYFSGGPSEMAAAAVYNYTCENYSLYEVVQMHLNAEPFMILVKDSIDEIPAPAYIIADSIKYSDYNSGYFIIEGPFGGTIYWGTKGISTDLNNACEIPT